MKCKNCEAEVPDIEKMPFHIAAKFTWAKLGAFSQGYCGIECWKREHP